jgi:hypothetical protein
LIVDAQELHLLLDITLAPAGISSKRWRHRQRVTAETSAFARRRRWRRAPGCDAADSAAIGGVLHPRCPGHGHGCGGRYDLAESFRRTPGKRAHHRCRAFVHLGADSLR